MLQSDRGGDLGIMMRARSGDRKQLAKFNVFVWSIGMFLVASLFSFNARADFWEGYTELVSLALSGEQGNGNAHAPALSGDGRYVAFLSEASNLVPGDTNEQVDVFVYDRWRSVVERVSVSTLGEQGDGEPSRPAISADGRYVVFSSDATNLVPNDTNNGSDVFVHDRQIGETTRLSITSSGEQADGPSFTRRPAISADGRYVVFFSHAHNLVANDNNEASDVYVRDRQAGLTWLISKSISGLQGNGDSEYPTISANGRYVAFYSRADNLVENDTNAALDVFRHDLQTGETIRVSVASDGSQGNGDSDLPAISGDGRFVAFFSFASNLVVNDTNNTGDIFIHDCQTGETTRVSVSTHGGQSDGLSDVPSLSADGRFVSFYSYASNLVNGDTNQRLDVFRHDRQTGETVRVSVGAAGEESNHDSLCSTISANGSAVGFYSFASNLIAEDTNNYTDIYIHDFSPPLVNRVMYLPWIAGKQYRTK